jgi:nucleoside-diphosphate-sugar epimerase
VIYGDLTNGVSWDALLDGIDCIYHVAGVTRAQQTRDYYTGNTEATKRVIDAILPRCNGKTRLVYVSSLTVVGPSRDGTPVDEHTPCRPISEYGKSKLLAEAEVLRAVDRMPTTIVRPAAVYGPRERDLLQYIHMARRGVAPLIGFGTKWVNFVHVHDLVDGIIRAGEAKSAEGEVYILGGATSSRVSDVGRAVALASKRTLVQIRLPHAVAYAVGAAAQAFGAMTGKQILFNIQKARETTQKAWTCSIEKAKRDLKYNPTIALNEGMKMTYDWYCQQGWMQRA